MTVPLRTRFAPSPTGLLHVGNGYSALICQQWAAQNNAELLLRIEDIDRTRCQPQFIDAIQRDLHWLGIRWQAEVIRQSQRSHCYQQAIAQLQQQNLLYPCFCSRGQIHAQMAASAPHYAQPHYPGTCRTLKQKERAQRMQFEPYAWRLNVALAASKIVTQLDWIDESGFSHGIVINTLDDVILARKDIGISYHLAVVVDDAAQAITMVIRGEDLRGSTAIQTLLQRLLNLPQPHYLHHPLVVDHNNKRLAKRNSSTTLHSLAQAGVSPVRLKVFLGITQETKHSPMWNGHTALALLKGKP